MRALPLLVAVGCGGVKSAPVVPPAELPAVTLCTTTETELRTALGTPTRDGLYHRARILSWILGEEPVVRYLAVMLDERGVVIDRVWNIPTEIPWTPTDQCTASAP